MTSASQVGPEGEAGEPRRKGAEALGRGTVLQRIQNQARRLRKEFVELCYPWACALCGATEAGSESDFPVNCYCCSCNDELTAGIEHSCERCAARVGRYTTTDKGCFHCRKRDLRFDNVTCLGMYEGLIRQAVLSAKWSFSSVAVDAIAGLMATERNADLIAANADVVLPIPQSWRSRVSRPFNPAAQIGRVVARSVGCPVDEHILCRSRHSRPQKRVAAPLRFDNQKDAFRVRDPHVIRGARVLLVDDVLTTGATCSEAARVLKHQGAQSCHVAVIARVLDNSA